MFSEWVGIDATSIWAAATSGPAAITVHLLACILARLFTVSEATSIWFELVERRQEQLKKAESEGLADESDISASKCQISRIHLAEWDAFEARVTGFNDTLEDIRATGYGKS